MSNTLTLNLRLQLGGRRSVALGPGKIRLLVLLQQTGSIREAAAKMGMSYMRAWTMIQTIKPLVIAARGGKGGGGAQLTEIGTKVIELYQNMDSKGREAVEDDWRALQQLFSN
jgi:molybdate transport system regulatory protein